MTNFNPYFFFSGILVITLTTPLFTRLPALSFIAGLFHSLHWLYGIYVKWALVCNTFSGEAHHLRFLMLTTLPPRMIRCYSLRRIRIIQSLFKALLQFFVNLSSKSSQLMFSAALLRCVPIRDRQNQEVSL